jgi:hypothetical protein
MHVHDGYLSAGSPRSSLSIAAAGGKLWVSSECISYAVVTTGNELGFERGFLGIVEAIFGIGEDKIRGNHQQALTNGQRNATL